MTRLKKTIARKLPCILKGMSELVVYLQPNGLIVLRKPHGRKRYGISLEYVWQKAKEAGPIGDLFAMRIQGCARPKPRKKAA